MGRAHPGLRPTELVERGGVLPDVGADHAGLHRRGVPARPQPRGDPALHDPRFDEVALAKTPARHPEERARLVVGPRTPDGRRQSTAAGPPPAPGSRRPTDRHALRAAPRRPLPAGPFPVGAGALDLIRRIPDEADRGRFRARTRSLRPLFPSGGRAMRDLNPS